MTRALVAGLLSVAGCGLPVHTGLSPMQPTIAVSPRFAVEIGAYHYRIDMRETTTTPFVVGPLETGYPFGTPAPAQNVFISDKFGPQTVAAGSLRANFRCFGDVRMVYDHTVQRFYFSSLGYNNDSLGRDPYPFTSKTCLAVSKTDDPRAGWWIGIVEANEYVADFPRLGFSDSLIVLSNLTQPVHTTVLNKANALNGVFGPAPIGLGLPGDVTPVESVFGTGADAMYISVAPGGMGLTITRWNPATGAFNQATTAIPVPIVATVAHTPSGLMAAGQGLSSAYLAGGLVWATGVTDCGNRSCVWVAAVWAYVHGAPTPWFHVADGPGDTAFPGIAVDGAGRAVVTALGTSAFSWPTHVAARLQVDFNPLDGDSTTPSLAFESVQNASRARNLNAQGNGSGPSVPPQPFYGLPIRGVDWLDATADPAGNIWMTGAFTAYGYWINQTVMIPWFLS